MMHHVNVSKYDVVGRFGLLENLMQEHTPKYDAVMNFISANPKWW